MSKLPALIHNYNFRLTQTTAVPNKLMNKSIHSWENECGLCKIS